MTPSNCEVGDLSNKHARIDIPGNPSPFSRNAFFYTDTFLNLSTVLNRSIAIHATSPSGSIFPIIACAPIVRVEVLTVQAVLGDFTAQQPNQFSNATITTNLTASNLLLLSSVIAPNQLCNTELSRGSAAVFNPYSSPNLDGSSETPDRYFVGDIARKYNFLIENRITEFPVYGTDTIAVRTLAESDRGMGYTCSSLWPNFARGSNVWMAKATFSGTVEGAIYFVSA